MSKKTVPMEVHQGGAAATDLGVAETHAMPPDQSMTRDRAPQPAQPAQLPQRAQPTHAGETLWVGRFRIVEQLGAGAAGIVYRAHDPHLDRMVAVKLLHAQSRAAGAHDDRLLREAKGLARIAHPNVVGVHDVGVHSGQLFVAMELVEGATLTDWIAAHGGDWRNVVSVMSAAGRGLHAIHQAGLVHRDFKPDNVLIDVHGRARIADFGLVRAAGDLEISSEDADYTMSPLGPAMTRTGALMGTPAFMAPEQLERRTADARSDQFAFCVTLYQAVYNQPAFVANTIADQMRVTASGAVQPLPSGNTVPRAVHAVIMRGLSPDPNQRYPDMEALLGHLAAAAGATGAATNKPPSRLGLWLALGGVALLIVLVGGAIGLRYMWQGQTQGGNRSSKAAAQALKKARKQLDDADYAGCSRTAAGGPRSEKLSDVWLTCALLSQKWDHAARACNALKKHGDGHQPTSCEPTVVEAYGLMAKKKWRSCLKKLTSDDDPNKHNLAVRLVCAHHAEDDDTYRDACKLIRERFPNYGAAQSCDPERGIAQSGTDTSGDPSRGAAVPRVPPRAPPRADRAGRAEPPRVPAKAPPPVPRHKPRPPPTPNESVNPNL